MQAGSVTSTVRAATAIVDDVGRRGADAAMSLPTVEETTRIAHGIVRNSTDLPSVADLRTLSRLADLPYGHRPYALTAHHGPASWVFDEAINQIGRGEAVRNSWDGWRILNRLRGEAWYPTREAAVARIDELARVPDAHITAADLHDLDGIRQLRRHLRPTELDHTVSVAEAAAAMGRRTGRAGEFSNVAEQLERIRLPLRWPTRDAATAEMFDIVRYATVDPYGVDTRSFRMLTSLRDELRPNGLKVKPGEPWDEITRQHALLMYPTREAASARVTAIASTPIDQLTPQQLLDYDGIRQLDDALRPAGIDRNIGASRQAFELHSPRERKLDPSSALARQLTRLRPGHASVA